MQQHRSHEALRQMARKAAYDLMTEGTRPTPAKVSERIQCGDLIALQAGIDDFLHLDLGKPEVSEAEATELDTHGAELDSPGDDAVARLDAQTLAQADDVELSADVEETAFGYEEEPSAPQSSPSFVLPAFEAPLVEDQFDHEEAALSTLADGALKELPEPYAGIHGSMVELLNLSVSRVKDAHFAIRQRDREIAQMRQHMHSMADRYREELFQLEEKKTSGGLNGLNYGHMMDQVRTRTTAHAELQNHKIAFQAETITQLMAERDALKQEIRELHATLLANQNRQCRPRQ